MAKCARKITRKPPKMNKPTIRYRKKPIVIEAVRVTSADFNGHSWDGSPFSSMPDWLAEAIKRAEVVPVTPNCTDYAEWQIKTFEDGKDGQVKHIASAGDYIIRGIQGELYLCKSDIFEATYDKEPDHE